MHLKVGAESEETIRLFGARRGERIEPRALGLMDRAGHVLARELRGAKDAPVQRFHRRAPVWPGIGSGTSGRHATSRTAR